MIKVGFITLGCKVNIYESNALKNELEAKGYLTCEADETCDAFIINTCSVTNMADAKSRKMIRKCIKMNEKAIVCVMGCYSQTNKEALELEGIDIIVGNGNKSSIIEKLEAKLKNRELEKNVDVLDILKTSFYEKLDVTTFDHTRAFVKIEDGCQNFCSYCIIPFARGPVRCKNSDAVIAELQRITCLGYKEVVLAGIHTGRYFDKEKNLNLSGLIKRILNEVTGLSRLRLSSIEINEVDDEFIELMRNNKVLANHMHLPLQSGSDTILKKMNRRYDLAFFLEKVNKIKNARPDISLTTDVIVGHPYEEEKEFLETIDFVKKVGFTRLHVFPYSKRAGTAAALMPQVNDKIKKDRTLRLIEVSNELENKYYETQINQEMSVIVEQKVNDKEMIGHTSNFLDVILPLDESLLSKEINVKITRIEDLKVYGQIIE